MKKYFRLCMYVIVLCACSSAKFATTSTMENALTEKEKSGGWELLFDGKSTAGWHGYGKDKPGSDWKISDNALMLDAAGEGTRNGGDLVTDQEYSNFDLKVDWKISPKGNSGIIFYSHEDTAKYHESYNTGLEMQVLDNGTPTRPGHDDGKLYSHRAGDLYDLLASKEAVHDQGEWNHVEIISLNGKLDFFMNGEHTLSTTLWDDNWRNMVAISKFKTMPDFGTYKQGRICLQDHGNVVWYKNIKIKRL